MSNFSIETFTENQKNIWNKFVEESNNGTLFHRINFLDYHGSKFKDQEQHLWILNGKTLYSVMPLAVFEENGQKIAKSPYCASYGGPIFKKTLNYSQSSQLVNIIIEYLKVKGVNQLSITLAPRYCELKSSDTFQFALLENGFKCTNQDVESVVDLNDDEQLLSTFNSSVRNKIKKAEKENIEINFDASLEQFYPLLESNREKFETKPTHSFEELKRLQKSSTQVQIHAAYKDNKILAGICHFLLNSRAVMTFYLAHDRENQRIPSQSYLIFQSMLKYKKEGYRWYSFGPSTEKMIANENILSFKESFGSVGHFRKSYSLSL